MGRRACPPGALTGTGFHWDEWYRNPSANLDSLVAPPLPRADDLDPQGAHH